MLTAYLPVAKLIVSVVAGAGASKIVSGIVKNNVIITTTTEKVLVNVGSFALGSLLWEQTSNHIDRATSEVLSFYEEHIKKDNQTEK